MLQPNALINGRYRILGTLGSGGMGSVYAVHDERLGREVALKLLRADFATDPRARERFIREAQIAAQLIHPNIVRTYDVGDAPEGPYLVQELLRGETLDARLPLPPHTAIAVAASVADALQYIHERGYVHCDIKPQNIMLLDDGTATPHVALLDFGIARVAGTDTTTLIATPHYLAPERAQGAAPTAASDLYALGIVLYHTLVGQPPFDGSLHAIMQQHLTTPVPPLPITQQMPSSTANAIEAIVQKLTAKQPTERYASAAALRADLAKLGTPDPHTQTTQPVVQRQPIAAPKLPPPAVVPAARQHKTIGKQYLALPLLFAALLLGGLALRAGAARGTETAPLPATTSQPSTAPSAEPISQPAIAPTATATLVGVPDVVGLPIDQAQQIIESAGLVFQIGDAVQSDQPIDTVVSINPAPDQALAPNTPVVAQISAGQPQPVVQPQPANEDDGGEDEGNDDNRGRGKSNSNKGKGSGNSGKDD